MKPGRKKNIHETSSRSFRIKERSTTSLHGKHNGDTNKTISNYVHIKFGTNHPKEKERNVHSIERSYGASGSSTLQNEKSRSVGKNNNLFQ